MELTCDDCGSIQSEHNDRCELCGASLHEEAERKAEGSLPALLAAAIVATGLLAVLPAFVIKFLWFSELGWPLFGLAYSGIWVVGIAIGNFYTPKDDYDFGYRAMGGWVDRPFTLKDDRDRAHATAGFILMPMNIVGGLWLAVFRKLT